MLQNCFIKVHEVEIINTLFHTYATYPDNQVNGLLNNVSTNTSI